MLRRQFMSMVSALVVALLAGGPTAGQAAGVSEKDALELGVEAYIYGYPLVTMEYDAAGDDQRRGAEGHSRADGSVRQRARVPGRRVQGRHGAERRHAVLVGLARPREGAVRAERCRTRRAATT